FLETPVLESIGYWFAGLVHQPRVVGHHEVMVLAVGRADGDGSVLDINLPELALPDVWLRQQTSGNQHQDNQGATERADHVRVSFIGWRCLTGAGTTRIVALGIPGSKSRGVLPIWKNDSGPRARRASPGAWEYLKCRPGELVTRCGAGAPSCTEPI